MTEDFSLKEPANFDEPIDLSKNSTLFQERIRREARPPPPLIPLNLISSINRSTFESEVNSRSAVEENSRVEYLNRVNMGVEPSRSRLARVQSFPYLSGRRRLSVSQKSKSESRISTAQSTATSSTTTSWNLNCNNERLSQLIISNNDRFSPVRQEFHLNNHSVTVELAHTDDILSGDVDGSLRPSLFVGSVRRGAGASPSTINHLKNYLQKKQKIQLLPDSNCSNKDAVKNDPTKCAFAHSKQSLISQGAFELMPKRDTGESS